MQHTPPRRLHFKQTPSTNQEAQSLSLADETGPLWITADEQTGGRGRLGRHWVSKPGNLYATLLFQPGCTLQAASQIGMVASLAVYDAVRLVAPTSHLTLKWPNDVLLSGAKLAGLLTEVVAATPQITIALGIGVNIAHAPDNLAYPAAALGQQVTADALWHKLAERMTLRLNQWGKGEGFTSIRSDWQSRTFPLSTGMSVNGVTGAYAGLDEDGGLMLRDDMGRIQTIRAGDVSVIAGGGA